MATLPDYLVVVSPAGRLAWILNSRKAQTALASLLAIVLAHVLGKLGFSDTAITEVTASIAALGGSLILGIAHEDAGAKANPAANLLPAGEPCSSGPVPAAAMSEKAAGVISASSTNPAPPEKSAGSDSSARPG